MKLRLVPKETTFFDMFEESSHHIKKASQILFDLIVADDFESKIDHSNKLSEIEHSADETTHNIYKKIYSTFVTPFSREYIYKFTHLMDNIVDLFEDISQTIITYKIESMPIKTKKFIKLLMQASNLCVEYIPQLIKPNKMSQFWIEINSIENECDRLYKMAIMDIFETEKNAIKIIKKKDVLEKMEKCADAFEALASIVEAIAIEES